MVPEPPPQERRRSQLNPSYSTKALSYETLYYSEMSPSASFGSSLNLTLTRVIFRIFFSILFSIYLILFYFISFLFFLLFHFHSHPYKTDSGILDDDAEKKAERRISAAEKKAEEKILQLNSKSRELFSHDDAQLEAERKRAEAAKKKKEKVVDDLKAQHQRDMEAMLQEETKRQAELTKRRLKEQKEDEEFEAKWRESSNAQRLLEKARLLEENKQDEEVELSRSRKAEKEDDLIERELNKEMARLVKEASSAKASSASASVATATATPSLLSPSSASAAAAALTEFPALPEAEPEPGTRPEPRLARGRAPSIDRRPRGVALDEPRLSSSPDPVIPATAPPRKDSVTNRNSRSLSLTNARTPDPVDIGLPAKPTPFVAAPTTISSARQREVAPTSTTTTTTTAISSTPSTTAAQKTPAATTGSPGSSPRHQSKNLVAHLYAPGSTLPTKSAATSASKQTAAPTPATTPALTTVTPTATENSRANRRGVRGSAGNLPSASQVLTAPKATAQTLTPLGEGSENPGGAPADAPADAATGVSGQRRKSFSDFPRKKEPPAVITEVKTEAVEISADYSNLQNGKEISLALQKYEEDPEQYQARVKMLQEDIGVARPGKIDPNLWTSVANESYMEPSPMARSARSHSTENLFNSPPESKRVRVDLFLELCFPFQISSFSSFLLSY